jgi:polyisoprenoid-binding protein YceI
MATGASMVPQKTLVQYTADPRVSRFTVKISTGGPLAKLGHNPTISIADFASDIECDPNEMEASHFTFSVHAKSLIVVDDMNDKDRVEIQNNMHDDVLETEKYPEISFASTAIEATKVLEGLYRLKVTGSLTLHGVTRRQDLTTQVVFMGESLRASGDFTFQQTDYGIKLFAVAAGALKIKDQLKFMFDVVARKVVREL